MSTPEPSAGVDSGPCAAWEPDPCVVFPDCAAPVSGLALDAATELLWARTGRRFGVCEVTLRPCRAGCTDDAWWAGRSGTGGGWGWPMPALVGGRWYNLGCGACGGDSCSCTVLHQVALPAPVAAILEVKIDGAVLDEAAYRVDDWRLLVRLDGQTWPACQDLTLPDTEAGTWSVTAAYGEAVPALGRLAVGALARAYAAGMCGCTGCKQLAVTVAEITRQGVRKKLFSADTPTGQTGVRQADDFIATFNPTRSSPASIYPIDGPRPRRVGTS